MLQVYVRETLNRDEVEWLEMEFKDLHVYNLDLPPTTIKLIGTDPQVERLSLWSG